MADKSQGPRVKRVGQLTLLKSKWASQRAAKLAMAAGSEVFVTKLGRKPYRLSATVIAMIRSYNVQQHLIAASATDAR